MERWRQMNGCVYIYIYHVSIYIYVCMCTYIYTHTHKYIYLLNSQLYDLRVSIDDGIIKSEKTFGQFELIHKQLQKYFIESMLPQ